MGQALPQDDMTAPEGLRLIDAAEWDRARWVWLESVRRDASINATARLVAHVLALDFANYNTLQCDPSNGDLADILGVSEDTVRRAIADLRDAHWIARVRGNGRRNKSNYGFLTSAKVVTLKGGKFAGKRGADTPPFKGSERVANLREKGSKFAGAYNKAKPYKNHKGATGVETPAPKRSENPAVIADAERAVRTFREGRRDALDDLQGWVRSHILAAGLLTDGELHDIGWTG
ncbi:helix-turn-helix domain-containing protein [Maritimibacter sp. DP1N21-5]|uniref:helix-turn-helix domain-containing protein n=1 Tax=Maritimibacter sp. DP1N21-5 TaxID=2836867 RepID=UPI001C45F05C|nr:helix-turn-helix domain-containing protein [Maritimibacter sp. DP1N21-5]MBV7408190.1 helix-turn-helix domain-containing protein [Maritimibacter sp. DP1N21-5]